MIDVEEYSMNKKSLIAFALAVTTVGTATVTTYASQNSANATKNKIVKVASQKSDSNLSVGNISDEEAIKMATQAMKDYMGKDASFFAGTKITRSSDGVGWENIKDSGQKEDAQAIAENAKKHMAKVIDVAFTPADNSIKFAQSHVLINEETGKLVGITALTNVDKNVAGVIDDTKLRTVTENFTKLIGKNIQEDSIRVQKMNKKGIFYVLFKLEDGTEASVLINSKDYSVVQYGENYNHLIILPSIEKFQNGDNFKKL
jgi:hypothetical protein